MTRNPTMIENREDLKEDLEEDVKEEKVLNKSLPAPADSMKIYMTEINKYPVLSQEEEYELATKYRKKGDLEAARKLITSNLRFVVKIANEYRNYGLNLMDLIQEGNMGLMQAVKRFDPERGYRLISYAVWWIRAYIQNYIIRSWRLVKIRTTQAQRKLFYKLRSTKQKLGITDEIPRPENYKRLAEELGVSDEAVKEMEQRMGSKELSLDTEIKERGEATHLDFLVDEVLSQEEVLTKIEEGEGIKAELEVALKALDDRERYVIENRTLRDKPITLEELGKRLNISRERVRQIENEALKKMRKEMKKKGR